MGNLFLCKMIQKIEERKINLVKKLEEEQNRKPERWWQTETVTFESTREAGSENGIVRQTSGETVIRYDLKGALISGALFFIGITLVMIVPAYRDGQFNNLLLQWILLTGFVFWPVIKALDRKPVLILDEKGIWFCKTGTFIEWKDLAAAYIKKEDNDGVSRYLQVHFYNAAQDSFCREEIYLDNLDINAKDLSAEIEYRRLLQ